MSRFQGLGVVLGLTIACHAFGPGTAGAVGQWGVAGFGGYNSYAMEDVNDQIGELNDSLAVSGISQRLDEISSGIGFGGGLRYRTASGMIVGLDFERLTASSDVSIMGVGVEMDAGANVVTATVNYLFPSSSRARFGLAGGLGYYSSAGKVSVFDPTTSASIEFDLKGNTLGFHGGGTVDVALGSTARLEALAGYRYAKASDVEIESFQTNGEIDWSGFMSRVGLAFYFGAQ